MRRSTRITLTAGLIGGLAAGVIDVSPSAAGWRPNVAVVTADHRVAVLRDGQVSPPMPGALSGNDAVVVTATAGAPGTTEVTWTVLASGSVTATRSVPGEWRVAVVDMAGVNVALTAEANGSTDIVVVNPEQETLRTTVPGWVELEAFQVGDGNVPFGIYALTYAEQPAPGKPTRYRVRQLSFATKQLELVQNLRDKTQLVDQNMEASALGGVFTESPAMHFGLYRGLEGDGTDPVAFIHITGLGGPFGAWCLDLDGSMGMLDHPATLSVGVDDSRLLAVSGTGMIAEIDTTTLAEQDPNTHPMPIRTVQAWTPKEASEPVHVAVAGGQIAVLQGGTIFWIDPVGLSTIRTSTVGVAEIDAFAVTADGMEVVVAGEELLSANGAGGFSPAVTGLVGGSTAVRLVLFDAVS